jgi:ribosomal protein L17
MVSQLVKHERIETTVAKVARVLSLRGSGISSNT